MFLFNPAVNWTVTIIYHIGNVIAFDNIIFRQHSNRVHNHPQYLDELLPLHRNTCNKARHHFNHRVALHHHRKNGIHQRKSENAENLNFKFK